MLGRTVALAAVLLAACATHRDAAHPSPLVGRPVALAAPDLEGREVAIGEGGGEVRLVDFWASWCDPCRDQLPFLDRLAAEHGPDGLRVYAISFDEDRAALLAFLEEAPVSFPVLWDKGGAALAGPLEITRLPTTLLLDREGVVREVHLGFHPREEPRIEEAVRRLLAEGR